MLPKQSVQMTCCKILRRIEFCCNDSYQEMEHDLGFGSISSFYAKHVIRDVIGHSKFLTFYMQSAKRNQVMHYSNLFETKEEFFLLVPIGFTGSRRSNVYKLCARKPFKHIDINTLPPNTSPIIYECIYPHVLKNIYFQCEDTHCIMLV